MLTFICEFFRADYQDEIDTSNEKLSTKSDKEIPKTDLNVKFLDMYSTIYSMRQELEQVRKPSGIKENPSRTCRDLFYGHPHLKDGKLNKCSKYLV